MTPPIHPRGEADRVLISVITVVRNGVAHLAQCLDSVQSQQGVSWEHIVVDGGSSDGSAELIAARHRDLAYWISEPDQGISDAMNKGIAQARGDWLLFLHADDHLLDSSALAQCHRFLDRSGAEIVGFPIRYGSADRYRLLRPRGGGWWLNLKTGLLHQGCFIRRVLFERLGGYDTRFRIAMDYEFFLRARRQGVRVATVGGRVPTLMRDTGIGSQTDAASLRLRFAEEAAIHRLHAPGAASRAAYVLYWALYPLLRQLRG